jgi:hypothetical protein
VRGAHPRWSLRILLWRSGENLRLRR